MLLSRSDILAQGEPYTFTYTSGEKLQDSESWVLEQLRFFMVNYGGVQSVARGFLSGRYVVTVIPSHEYDLADWMAGFEWSFQQMGWENNLFIQAEGGKVSGSPGGLKQAVVETVTGIAETVGGAAAGGLGAMLKELAPYLILVAGGLLAYEYLKPSRSK